MNEFEAKWADLASGGHSAGRFRVYPDHLLNFHVQYSLAGCREVVIDVLGEDLPMLDLPAFRNIDLVFLKIAGGIRIGMSSEFSVSIPFFRVAIPLGASPMCWALTVPPSRVRLLPSRPVPGSGLKEPKCRFFAEVSVPPVLTVTSDPLTLALRAMASVPPLFTSIVV